MVQRLEYQDARALAEQKAVAVLVERATGCLRIVVAARERARARHRDERQRQNRRLGAASHHRLGIAAPQEVQRLEHRIHARRARRGVGHDRAFDAVMHRHLARGHIGDHERHHHRADALPALGDQRLGLYGDGADATTAGGDDGAHVVLVLRRDLQPRGGKRLTGGGDRKLREALHATRGLAIHVVAGVEALDLGRHLHR